MTIPPCPTQPRSPPATDIDFPGGGEIASVHQALTKIPTPAEYLLNAFTQAGPGLAPFKPFFDLLALSEAMSNCQKAVPKAISELSPDPVLDCIPDVLEKLDAVVKLEPHLSVPVSAASLIDAAIEYMGVAIDILVLLLDRYDELTDWKTTASRVGDTVLDSLLDCADADLNSIKDNVRDGASSIGPLMALVQRYLEEADLDVVLDLEDPPLDLPIEELTDFLREMRTLMLEARRLIPI